MGKHTETMTKIMAVPYVTLLFHVCSNTHAHFKTSQPIILQMDGHRAVPDVVNAM